MFGFPLIIALGINIGVGVVYGLCGNWWYRLHAEQELRELAPTGASDEATHARIARAGGTSGGAIRSSLRHLPEFLRRVSMQCECHAHSSCLPSLSYEVCKGRMPTSSVLYICAL